MTPVEISTSLKTTHQGLSMLSDEHSMISSTLQAITCGLNEDEISLPREKNAQITENFEKLLAGIDETSLMMLVAQMMRSDDVKIQKARDIQKLLKEENGWLRDELAHTQKRLQEAESEVVRLQEELDQLRFLESMKTINIGTTSSILGDDTSRIPALSTVDLDTEDDSEDVNQSTTSCQAPSRLQALNSLVVQFMKEGRTEIVGPLCKQALEELVSTNGQDHPDVATMLNILALVCRDHQKYKEASGHLERALEIRMKCFGEAHQLVASTLNNMAVIFGKRGKHQEAELNCRRALKIRERIFGENDLNVAKQLNNLALICLNLGKYEEVENCHRKALRIVEKTMGIDSEMTIKTQNQLASILLKQGKYEGAERVYKAILTRIHVKNGGIEGESLWEQAENGGQKMVKELQYLESADIITSIKNLAAIYRKYGKYEAAESLETATLRGKNSSEDSHSMSNISMEVSRNTSQNGVKSKILHILGFKF